MLKIRSFLAAIFLMMLAGCCNLSKTAYSPDTLQHYKDATVAFVVQDEDGDIQPYCSGFFVDDGLLMTAHHCLVASLQYQSGLNIPAEMQPLLEAMMKNIDLIGTTMIYETEREMPEIGTQPKIGHIAKAVYDDPEHDLSVLEVKNTPFHRTLDISDKDPVLGEEVVEVGHPAGLTWSVAYGRVSDIRAGIEGFVKKGPFVQIAAPVIGGNSGGAVISANTGEVIGLVSFGSDRFESYGFAIHRRSLFNCLKSAREFQKKTALERLKIEAGRKAKQLINHQ